MKIVFLEAVQNFGGARISTLELAERLSDKNDVLIMDFYGSCKPFVASTKNRGLKLKIIDARVDPFIIKGSLNRIINALNSIRYIPHWFKMRRNICRELNEFNPDFIVVNNYKTLSVFLGTKFREKVLFFARGWMVPHKISFVKRALLKSLVNKYICVAEATRQALYAGNFADLTNLYVVHNAIDENSLPKETISIKSSPNQIVLLHAGGFLPEKGQGVSIEVVKKLKELNLNVKLILAGLVYKGEKSSRFYNDIVKRINDLSLNEEVVIIKDKTNIIPYFRGADIIIHPSDTEGLPRVVMEALCLKKPVIANGVGGVVDYILPGFTGFITNFNNVDDYVEYVKLLVENPTLYKKISENGYSLIDSCFDADNQLHSFMKALSK